MEKIALINILLYFIFPLWILVGFLDWLCHRRTHLAHNSGVKESLIHSLMFLEIGIPVSAGLILEITPLLLIFMILMFLIHEITAMWDVSYAVKYRYISPVEQQIHSFLELLPLFALLIVVALHWDAFMAIFDGVLTDGKPVLRLKDNPIPLSYLVPLFTGILFLLVLPFIEELWRSAKLKKSTTNS